MGRPVWSPFLRKLSPADCKYAGNDQKHLALVGFLILYRCSLGGQQFNVVDSCTKGQQLKYSTVIGGTFGLLEYLSRDGISCHVLHRWIFKNNARIWDSYDLDWTTFKKSASFKSQSTDEEADVDESFFKNLLSTMAFRKGSYQIGIPSPDPIYRVD